MQYKTIVLELLQQHPQMYEQLRQARMLLPTMELLANELKTNHEAWRDRLLQTKPDSSAEQIASEALEMALKALEERLPSESPPEEDDPLSLEAETAFLRPPTRPA